MVFKVGLSIVLKFICEYGLFEKVVEVIENDFKKKYVLFEDWFYKDVCDFFFEFDVCFVDDFFCDFKWEKFDIEGFV